MEKLELMAKIANEFIKGASCTVVVNKSADSAMRKTNNPFLGRVTIRKTYSGYVMGTDYSASLINTAGRMGNEGEPNLKKVWHKPTERFGEWFSTDKKTESKVYLKLQRNAKQVAYKVETIYYLDGVLATPTEVAEIEGWLTKRSHTQSSTQTEMGIDKEHEQSFILPQLDTITLIKQGDREIHPAEVLALVPSLAL